MRDIVSIYSLRFSCIFIQVTILPERHFELRQLFSLITGIGKFGAEAIFVINSESDIRINLAISCPFQRSLDSSLI